MYKCVCVCVSGKKHVLMMCTCVDTVRVGGSTLSERDNDNVWSPCLLIKGLRSLAASKRRPFVLKREKGTQHGGVGVGGHVLSVTARTQYFAIFLRLGLFTRSYR